jgi:DNA-binding NarL/FixJ family response regulator
VISRHVNSRFKRKSAQRVLLIRSGSLLDEGVESLLKDKVELNVVNLTASREAALLEHIACVRPSVILLNEADPAQATRMFALLKKAPTVRIIVTRLNSNAIEVYDKQEIHLARTLDLISLIQAGNGRH